MVCADLSSSQVSYTYPNNYRVLQSRAELSHAEILPRNVAEHEKHC